MLISVLLFGVSEARIDINLMYKSNKNNMNKFLLSFFVGLFSIWSLELSAQCTPPSADECEDANVLCSLDEVNGYTCQNTTYSNPTGCSPLCPSGGGAHNTGWWAFVCDGGPVTITITFSNCSVNGTGVQMGIWGDCDCNESIVCNPNCNGAGSFTLSGNLTACKTYYLFVDGCSGDVCDFTLTTSGGSAPMLPPLGNIMGPRDVCKGACNIKYTINTGGACDPTYEWTLDGTEIGSGLGEVTLDFPDEGDFQLCVTAYIGNPQSGSICDQDGPKCITIRVRPIADKIGPPWTLCNERIPFNWHGEQISATGEYRHEFTDRATCCKFDSVRQFIVLEVPEPPDVYHLGCDNNDVYIDPTTRQVFSTCQNGKIVNLPKSTDPWRCDSTYKLTAIFLDYNVTFREYCIGGKLEIQPRVIDRTKTCGAAGLSTDISYKWFLKNDPSKKAIGNDEILTDVEKKDDYCVEIKVLANLGDKAIVCFYEFCEQFDEDQFKPKKVCPKGDLQVCKGKTGIYYIDTILPNDVYFLNWNVSGGTILTKNAFDTTVIEVLWNTNAPVGTVCFNFESNCGPSPECCIDVEIVPSPAPDAGPVISVCGLSTSFQGKKDVGGQWTKISGPGNVTYSDQFDDKSAVTVDQYGTYVFGYTETRLGCITTDSTTINFNDTPSKSAANYICNSNNKDYTFNFQISGGKSPYTVIKGNGTVSPLGVYNSGVILNLANDTVIIRDVNGCEFTFIHVYECKCTNNLGNLDKTQQILCEDGVVVINYDPTGQILDPSPNKDTIIFFIYTDPNNPYSSRIRDISSLSIPYDPTFVYGQTYYVGVILGRTDNKGGIDQIKGCLRVDGGVPFAFYKIPAPNAGPDDAICGRVYDLGGFQSIPGSRIEWRLVQGPSPTSGVLFNNTLDPASQVSALGDFGTYVFELEENNNDICIQKDLVSITFNPSPEVRNVEPKCVAFGAPGSKDGKFVVEADLMSGKAPYTLLTAKGTITGNKWVSDTLASLDTFSIQIQDANGCISQLTIDIYNCNCDPIDAGNLDSLLTRVCEDECVPIKNLIPESINAAEDVAIYILHKGSYNDPSTVLDTLYSINDIICFDKTKMLLGVETYFITRVVGEDLAPRDGVVDIKDPCKRISNNQPIIWEPYPLADAGLDKDICGLTFPLDANLTLGNGTWRQIGGSNAVFADPNAPSTTVTVPGYGTYNFEWAVFNYSCDAYDSVTVTFLDAPEFIDNTYTVECDNTAENYRVRITSRNGNRPSWNIQGEHSVSDPLVGSFEAGDRWLTDWIPQGNPFLLTIRDKNNCLVDSFQAVEICNCITDAGVLTMTPNNLCFDAAAQANYTVAPGVLDGNDIFRYVLYDGTAGNPRAGTIISFNDNGRFVFDPATMQLGKTYYIAVFVGNIDPTTGNVNFTDRCLDNTPGVPVAWFSYPVAAINGPTELNCKVTSITLNGAISTSGSGDQLAFNWTTSNGQFVNPGQVTGATVDINRPGTYNLEVVDPRAGCRHQTSFVVTQDIVKPTVDIKTPGILTCDVKTLNLDGTGSSTGAIYQPTWSGPGNLTGGSTYTPTVNAVGTYTLTVENLKNGCVDLKTINVTEDVALPVADISQKGNLTCTVNQIQLDASGSRANSGTIGTYTWTGNVLSGQGTNTVTIGKPGGSFIVTVKDSKNGCIDSDTIDVTEIGNPLADLLVDPVNPKCFGERNGTITVNQVLDVNNQPLGNLQFSFNGGPFTSSKAYNNLGQGSYKITVKDPNGCLLERTYNLIEPGKLGIEVIKSIVVDQGSLVRLDSLLIALRGGTSANGAYKDTTWFNIDQQVDWESKLNYLADTTREFLITGIDQAGCEISDRVRVLVRIIKDVWWPTVVSSNGDNLNDHFNVYGKRVRNVRLLQIYDRWGSQVYSQTNLPDGNTNRSVGWSGEFKGKKALPGVYVFYAEVEYEGSTGFEKVKGEFTLLR